MLPSVLFLWALSPLLVPVQSDSLDTCDTNFNLMEGNKTVDIHASCKTVPCLTKCCAEKQILYNGTSVTCESTAYLELTYNVSNLEDYSGLEIYNKDIKREIIKTRKNTSDFKILNYENFIQCSVAQKLFNFMAPYVLENGTLKLRLKRINKWINSYEVGEFCFENFLSIDASSTKIVFYRKASVPPNEKAKEKRAVISANCMMVSCVFLVLVLVVYSLLKELRNLAGIMLMAYVATFTAFFLLRIIHVYANYYNVLFSQGCIVMTLLVYYALLSSFAWMNIMSFDIWWALRATSKELATNRRGILVKFAWYGLYGWGAPLLPTAFVVLADHVDLPGVVQPHVFREGGCFFGEDSHKYYVRYPIALLVCANFVWFVLTAYNIWLIRRAISQYNKESRENSKKNETRFLVYVKLSLLMGISRIFDAIDEEHWFYYVMDGFNACVGLFIFILFVCRRKLFLRLCARFSIDNKLVQSLRGRSLRSTQTSSTQRSTNIEKGHSRGPT